MSAGRPRRLFSRRRVAEFFVWFEFGSPDGEDGHGDEELRERLGRMAPSDAARFRPALEEWLAARQAEYEASNRKWDAMARLNKLRDARGVDVGEAIDAGLGIHLERRARRRSQAKRTREDLDFEAQLRAGLEGCP